MDMTGGLSVETAARLALLLDKPRRDPRMVRARLPESEAEREAHELLMRRAQTAIDRHDLRGGRARRAAIRAKRTAALTASRGYQRRTYETQLRVR